MKNTLLAIALLAGLAGSAGCDHRSSGRSPATWEEHDAELRILDSKLKELAEKIKHEQGQGQCKATEQCHVVGLGAKVCGGYSNFLIYSDQDTPEGELLSHVSAFNAEAERLNKTAMSATPCGVLPKAPQCISERCRILDPK